MKEAGLMGEMITCHGYKNGWRSEDSLSGNRREMGFFFSFFFPFSCWGARKPGRVRARNHFKVALAVFFFFFFLNEVLAEQFNGRTGSGLP